MVRESRVQAMKEAGFDLYTPDEAAKLGKVSVITVYRQISCGELEGRKVGGSLRIERRALEAWLSKKAT